MGSSHLLGRQSPVKGQPASQSDLIQLHSPSLMTFHPHMNRNHVKHVNEENGFFHLEEASPSAIKHLHPRPSTAKIIQISSKPLSYKLFTHAFRISPHMDTSITWDICLVYLNKLSKRKSPPCSRKLGGFRLRVVKHRVLQREVVVKTSQVEVLGHQHVWDEGEAGLHGQDVRS